MVLQLEEGMLNYAEVIKKYSGKNIKEVPGSGAAGGLGAGCLAFLNAQLKSGIDLVFAFSKAEEHVKNSDIVVSGEGKLDEQSLNGKVISGLAALCRKYNKPLIALCGKLELSKKQLKEAGITSAIFITPEGTNLIEAYRKAYLLLANASERMFNGFRNLP
jgi:glycerate 2-kinase